MIKVVTTEASVFIPIAQIKTMVYNRKRKIVNIFHVDGAKTNCENVIMVYFNSEEI